jgi:PIN domain
MTRRYIFIFYPDLTQLDLKLLEQVSDRIFIFVSEAVPHIPIALAKDMQRLGKSLKWVTMETDDTESRKLHLSFLLGKLHEKVPTDIEFAVMSDDTDFDAVIGFVNKSRRKCMRVRIDEEIDEIEPLEVEIASNGIYEHPQAVKMILNEEIKPFAYTQSIREDVVIVPVQDHGIMSAAAKVRERMLRSGNRPAEIELLKEYIILSTPNLQPGTADRVIDLLATNKDIEIEDREILYHF